MNTDVRRIRPQSKRKAINASAFVERYAREAAEALRSGDYGEARKLIHKARYWQARVERIAERI